MHPRPAIRSPSSRTAALATLVLALAGCPPEAARESASHAPEGNGTSGGSSSEPPQSLEESSRGPSATDRPPEPQSVDAGTVATASPAPDAAVTSAAPEEETPVNHGPRPIPRPAMSEAATGQFRQGLSSAQGGDLATARTAFEGALSTDPHAFAAAYSAGIIAERQGQDAQADSFYQRAIAIQPDYELALVARSRLLLRQRRRNEAVAMAADMARRNPGNFTVRAEYARLLVVAGRPEDAISESRQILRVDERNVGAKLAVAEAYRALGRLDLALYIVDDLINGPDAEHHPNNGPGTNDGRAHFLRAELRVQVSHDVPGAIASLRRAVELDPQFAEARNNLGVFLLQSGNVEEAVAHLRAAVALSPTWAKPHVNLGDALRAQHNFDEALRELQRGQQLDATLVEVHYDYGRLFAEQARDIPSTGADNLNRKLQLLQQAQAAFTRYRDVLGANYATDPRRGDVDDQLTRLAQQVERTTRSRERAMRSQNRSSARPAASAAPSGAPP